jgi:hypothetical protein
LLNLTRSNNKNQGMHVSCNKNVDIKFSTHDALL